MPACHELAEAMPAECEPFGDPRSLLGLLCCVAKIKAVPDPCFSSCADTQSNQGLTVLQDTFFPAVRQKPPARVLQGEKRKGKPTASLY